MNEIHLERFLHENYSSASINIVMHYFLRNFLFQWIKICSEYYDYPDISKAQKVRIAFLLYHRSLLITFIIGIFFGKIVIKYN